MANSPADVVDLTGDLDEDEALRYAIALSLEEQDKAPQQEAKPSHSTSREPQISSAAFSLASLDRKKMEEERLQRLAKRRRASSDQNAVELPPAKRKQNPEAKPSASLLPFPKGVIKRTWARGYPRTSDDIKIEEVFQKDKLLLAVLCSFQWDDEWIISKLNLAKTKLLLVAYAADEAQVRYNRWTFVLNLFESQHEHKANNSVERSDALKCAAWHSLLLSSHEWTRLNAC